MPRLFTAIDLPEDVRKQIAAVVPAPSKNIRPVRSENLHLTLHFLGETEESTVVDAISRIQHPVFTIVLSGCGTFSNREGKILWIGIEKSGPLQTLHAALGKQLLAAGFAIEKRPYSPHITVARTRRPGDNPVVEQFLKSAQTLPPQVVSVSAVQLYRSQLTSRGSRYELVASFPLQ